MIKPVAEKTLTNHADQKYIYLYGYIINQTLPPQVSKNIHIVFKKKLSFSIPYVRQIILLFHVLNPVPILTMVKNTQAGRVTYYYKKNSDETYKTYLKFQDVYTS